MEQMISKAGSRGAPGGPAETAPVAMLTGLRVHDISGRELGVLAPVPADATPAEIIEQLLEQKAVEPAPAAQAYQMAVREDTGFRQLDPAQTLEAAGVPSGATLLLVSSAPGAAPTDIDPDTMQGTCEEPRVRRMGSHKSRPSRRIVIRRVKPGPPPVEPEPVPRRIEANWAWAAVRVYVAESAMEQIWRAVGRCPRCGRTSMRTAVERGGALVGRYATSTSGRPFVLITDAIPAHDAPSSSHFINIRVEDWLQIIHQQLTEMPGRRLLGWYHSQPGLGVRMSWIDLKTQRSLFGADWQLALVVDPLTGAYRFYRGGKARRVRWLAFVGDAEPTSLEASQRAGCQDAPCVCVTELDTEIGAMNRSPGRPDSARVGTAQGT